MRTLGEEVTVYCGWRRKAECVCLIAKQEALIHWQRCPPSSTCLCLFYNKSLQQMEGQFLGSTEVPWVGCLSPALWGAEALE